MKKFILAIFIAIILTGSGYSQVALSTKDSLTSLQNTDIMLWQRKVTGTFLNRQMSYNNLKLTLKDYLDGQAITWASRQTFTGATFQGGAYGSINFQDTVNMVSATKVLVNAMDRTTASARIGLTAAPYLAIYSRNFVVVNDYNNDSVLVSYDDSTLSFNKPMSIGSLSITDNFAMDSAAAIQALKLEPESYAITDVNDTVITATTLMSNMQLTLPGDVTRGIETINMTGAAIGHILIIYTTDADDSVLIQQESDGNLLLDAAGDFWLRSGDNMGFMYMYDQPALQFRWMELWRKNN